MFFSVEFGWFWDLFILIVRGRKDVVSFLGVNFKRKRVFEFWLEIVVYLRFFRGLMVFGEVRGD